MKKWIGDGLNSDLKTSTRNNVLNLIRALVEDNESVVYIPNTYMYGSKYRSSKDPAVHFLPSECGRSVRVIGVQSNQERYNFSLTCLVDVVVEKSNEDGSVDLLDKKVFRQYNIIRDGKLTVDYVSAKLSKDSFDSLKKLGILYYNGVKVEMNHNYKSDYVYKVMLNTLPLISYNWAQPIRIGLIGLLQEEKDISEKVKLMKSVLKSYPVSVSQSVESEIYVEKYNGSEEVEGYEPVTVKCVVYSIRNLAENKVTKEEIEAQFPDYDTLSSEISRLNKELKRVRFLIRSVTYAIESTKQESYNWTKEEKVPRSKSKTFQECEIQDENGNKYILVRTMYEKKF